MKTEYVNINQLKNLGTNFMKPQDKFVFTKACNEIEKLADDALGNKDISRFEADEILDEFWVLDKGDLKNFREVYSSSRKRRKLLIVFNILHNEKRISTSTSLKKVLDLFKEDTSEVALNKWVSSLISSWEQVASSKVNFDLLKNFIENKFSVSPLKLARTKLLDQNKKLYLDSKGPHYFAQEIVEHKISHEQYCEEVGIRFESNAYHSLVTEELFEFYLRTKKYNIAAEVVEQIALTPSRFSIRTRKKVLSAFIVQVENKDLTEYKELAKSAGFDSNVIGDPEKLSNWGVWEGGIASDKLQMENARLILNKWILTSFVDVFFNLLINDPKRKAYWLEKIPLIMSVKVYGSSDVKRMLKRDERISPYVDNSRFKMIHSGNSNAGILMKMGKYQIIEFTDSGALYCYDESKERLPVRPDSISDLKHPKMVMACSTQETFSQKRAWLNGKQHYLNAEGRIVHNGTSGSMVNGKIKRKDSWMERMDLWIKHFAS